VEGMGGKGFELKVQSSKFKVQGWNSVVRL